jgi:hypothetical protein
MARVVVGPQDHPQVFFSFVFQTVKFHSSILPSLVLGSVYGFHCSVYLLPDALSMPFEDLLLNCIHSSANIPKVLFCLNRCLDSADRKGMELDDLLFLSPSRSASCAIALLDTCRQLGMPVAVHKTEGPVTQCLQSCSSTLCIKVPSIVTLVHTTQKEF